MKERSLNTILDISSSIKPRLRIYRFYSFIRYVGGYKPRVEDYQYNTEASIEMFKILLKITDLAKLDQKQEEALRMLYQIATQQPQSNSKATHQLLSKEQMIQAIQPFMVSDQEQIIERAATLSRNVPPQNINVLTKQIQNIEKANQQQLDFNQKAKILPEYDLQNTSNFKDN